MKMTDGQKTAINELYYQNHNKSLTARSLGISVYAVNKYLIPNYVPEIKRQILEFTKEPNGCSDFIRTLLGNNEDMIQAFRDYVKLSQQEKKELKELQEKEVFESEF